VNSEANTRRITNVEKCFGASGQPLGISSRVLVGEGVLTKLCRKKPKPRQVGVSCHVKYCYLLSYCIIIHLKSFVVLLVQWHSGLWQHRHQQEKGIENNITYHFPTIPVRTKHGLLILQYNKQHILPLEGVQLLAIEDDGGNSLLMLSSFSQIKSSEL
jgi:hypothetical protein